MPTKEPNVEMFAQAKPTQHLYPTLSPQNSLRKAWEHLSCHMTQSERRGAGVVPSYKYVQNKPERVSYCQAEYSQSCKCLESSCLAMEHVMMRSSRLFECGCLVPYIHDPPSIHLTSFTWCVPRPFPFLATLSLPCIILKANQRKKKWGGLGTRLCSQITSFRWTSEDNIGRFEWRFVCHKWNY